MALTSPRFRDNKRLQKASENDPPLRSGCIDEAVRILQQALIDLGFPLPISVKKFGSPDGIYGPETKAAVMAFQKKHGLSADGIAGRDTLGKMDKLLAAPAPAPPPLPAPAYDRKVRLHFRSAAVPVVPEFTALANAQRVYDQIRVKLEFVNGFSIGLSADEVLQLNASDGTCNWDQASDEQTLLSKFSGGRQGVGPNDVVVFYANKIEEKGGKKLNGCAGHKPGEPTVVVAAGGTRWTLGHELGHVLLGPSFDPVHDPADKTNLMFAPTASITADPPGFTAAQTTAIRASKFCLPM